MIIGKGVFYSERTGHVYNITSLHNIVNSRFDLFTEVSIIEDKIVRNNVESMPFFVI